MGAIRVQLQLDPAAASPRRARCFVADLLDEWGLSGRDNVVDTAVLLVSELVTNAVLHARSSVDLIVLTQPRPLPVLDIPHQDQVLRIEVHDNSQALPHRRYAGLDAESGRGLALVDALADRWGVSANDHGKNVWFELQSPLSQSSSIPCVVSVRHW